MTGDCPADSKTAPADDPADPDCTSFDRSRQNRRANRAKILAHPFCKPLVRDFNESLDGGARERVDVCLEIEPPALKGCFQVRVPGLCLSGVGVPPAMIFLLLRWRDAGATVRQ